jgi:two-component sensor histidine kinase
MLREDDRALLDFFQEPVLVVTPKGVILQANAASICLVGPAAAGRDLASCLATPVDDVQTWLNRCSGTTAPLVGMLVFNLADGGTRRTRVHGARLRDNDDEVRIAVRCTDADSDRFSLLKKEVGQLNAEARERRHRQAMLEEALADNEVMLRELNHRVKNNIQLMVGLFSAAQRETASQEVKDVFKAASQRLLAVGAAQDLMYETQQMTTVPAEPFIKALTQAISVTLGQSLDIDVAADAGALSNDVVFPLALIFNELVTNAVKYGLPGGHGRIEIMFERRGDDFCLIVQDDGPGIPDDHAQRRSSGLGLVRGLCRQIGGKLSIENDKGARVTVCFSDTQEGTP